MKLPFVWHFLVFVVVGFACASAVAGEARTEVDLSGSGWHLWLDRNAAWENDELFPPPVDVSKLPVNEPTGGWDALNSNAIPVSVPGTVEEYLSRGHGPEDDIKGVSWWIRRIKIPKTTSRRRLLLRFESVRLRAEVFVNHKLVGYDVVGNTPFEVDISDAAKPGEEVELAIRITDPGGNFDWRDSSPFRWGKYIIPMSHGFGGITGSVRLVCCDPVYVDDIYVQNTPEVTNVNVIATIKNTTGTNAVRWIGCDVLEKSLADKFGPLLKRDGPSLASMSIDFVSEPRRMELSPGENKVSFEVSLPHAKLWDLDHPNLYVCEVRATDEHRWGDSAEQTFGFRWFAPEGIGSNAVFRLNGKRIVLRTAISWGFWPVNGLFPTPAQSEKEVRLAKTLGQNMLNFHRCIGHPETLDKADELGLLFYEEPGAYVNGDDSPFAHGLAREKLLRMVKRDRSHPSLVIYNMINEAWASGGADKNPEVLDSHKRDMQDAHALDPSRTMTHTSAWSRPDVEEPPKMQMRPFDDVAHLNGWYDDHHAGGPEVWQQSLYKSPTDYYHRIDDRREIVYWGEEGAISTPPRLELIKNELAGAPHLGWDGAGYLEWYRQFDDFITRKNLRGAFPTVDALTTAMGAVSLYHQGRKIETIRINDATDGYAVNGWEAELVENHSGIVDCFRNPKGDPAIMAYYNQSLYVAVKTRSQFAQIPGEVTVDFYIINEKNVHGAHTLDVSVKDPTGKEMFAQSFPVTVSGGEVYGQLLKDNVTVPIAGATGMFRVEAVLRDAEKKQVTIGHDEVLAVDWKGDKLGGSGATWETKPQVRDFLQKEKHLSVAAYQDNLPRLDWVVTTRPPAEGDAVDIPGENLRLSSGGAAGVMGTFFNDPNFRNQILQRRYDSVNYFVPDGAAPDQNIGVMENYGVRFAGTVVPPASGDYTFTVDSNEGVRLWVNDELLFDDLRTRSHTINRGRIKLEADKPVALRVEMWHRKGDSRCKLLWAPPEADRPDIAKLMQRVKQDGTALFILDRADTWMDVIQQNTSVKYSGSFSIGTAWLGGLHFVRAHPLFNGLPVNTAMSWPYQAVVRNGKTRSGLLLEGEELVAGAWHSYPMSLGSAVGVIPCGRGHIVVSTLDIADQLRSRDTSAEVARKLMCNFIAFAEPHH